MTEESLQAARNRARERLTRVDAALEADEIDEATWYAEVAAVITPAWMPASDSRVATRITRSAPRR